MHRVLVLGAGSSFGLGYPTGEGLRKKIFDLSSENHQPIRESAGLDIPELADFTKEFQRSQILSVDSFLARRPEYGEVGKRAIATVLLDCEDENKFWNGDNSDNWMQIVHNSLLDKDLSNHSFRELSVITFNYDRSFEHYMLGALVASYGVSIQEAEEKVKELELVHVYGSLGKVFPSEIGYHQYLPRVFPERVRHAADEIRVIPESRNSDPTLVKAREILSKATHIMFLGYGFDRENTSDRLMARETTANARLYATCKGATNAERTANYLLCKPIIDSQFGAYTWHANNTCSQQIRENVFFSPSLR
jgi:hypothetical protein